MKTTRGASRARVLYFAMVAVTLVAIGCGGGDGGGPIDPQILAIVLSPDPIVLPRVGAVMQATVTALTTGDPRDLTSDPATSYTSGNTSVAGVVSGGEVIASGVGETTIVARNGTFSDTAVVRVDTLAAIAVSSVVITPSAVMMTAIDQARGTTTTVTWANGAELRELSGAPIAYASSDQAVAIVDAGGVITARGQGSAIVTASFGGESDSVQVTVNTAVPVSFSQQILPLFTGGPQRCTDGACHPGSGTPQRNLRMNSYTNITSGSSLNGPIVVSGDGASSLLVRVLRGGAPEIGAARMPKSRTPFPAATIDLIERWIDEGANNN